MRNTALIFVQWLISEKNNTRIADVTSYGRTVHETLKFDATSRSFSVICIIFIPPLVVTSYTAVPVFWAMLFFF